MLLQKKKFEKAIEENNFKYMKRYFNNREEEVINDFDYYLFLAENSDNENFISNFLNLFVVDNKLYLSLKNLEELRDFLDIMQKEKNYNIINNIIKQNYKLPVESLEEQIFINQFIVFNYIKLNNKKALKNSIELIEDIEAISNILPYALKHNKETVFFLLENFKWNKTFKESQTEEVLNHPYYIQSIMKEKIEKF